MAKLEALSRRRCAVLCLSRSQISEWSKLLQCWHANYLLSPLSCHLSSFCWAVNCLSYIWSRSAVVFYPPSPYQYQYRYNSAYCRLEVGYISMPSTLPPVLLVWLLVVSRYVWEEQNYTHHLFLPPGLTKFGWMTSTVMGPMSVCASVSTIHPTVSLVTALKLSLSTAVCYHIITFYYVSHLIRFQGLGVAWRSLFLHKYYLVCVVNLESAMANATWEILSITFFILQTTKDDLRMA